MGPAQLGGLHQPRPALLVEIARMCGVGPRGLDHRDSATGSEGRLVADPTDASAGPAEAAPGHPGFPVNQDSPPRLQTDTSVTPRSSTLWSLALSDTAST
jgi:hypothetical protein